MRLPNLLIVGAQKCGTTWLHASLCKSTHIFGSATKELDFFNKPRFSDHIDAYATNFPEKLGASLYMESTPHYFRLPSRKIDIAVRIRDTLNNPKIIVILRNPVHRYESALVHHMMEGRLPYEASINWVRDVFGLVSLGRYGEILAHWQSVLPGIGVFFYDDVVKDSAAFISNIFDFLEVPNDLCTSDIDFRANDKETKFLMIQLASEISIPTDKDEPNKAEAQWSQMPELTRQARIELQLLYLDDIARLERITGRDLTNWRSTIEV
jgi:hypothetical protein